MVSSTSTHTRHITHARPSLHDTSWRGAPNYVTAPNGERLGKPEGKKSPHCFFSCATACSLLSGGGHCARAPGAASGLSRAGSRPQPAYTLITPYPTAVLLGQVNRAPRLGEGSGSTAIQHLALPMLPMRSSRAFHLDLSRENMRHSRPITRLTESGLRDMLQDRESPEKILHNEHKIEAARNPTFGTTKNAKSKLWRNYSRGAAKV